MNKLDADALLEQIAEYEKEISMAESERDEFIAHYQEKISRAQDICDKRCNEVKIAIAYLSEQLRSFASELVTDKKRSVNLPSGTLSFRKQSPKFFFDDAKEVTADNSRLIELVKKSAPDYLKVKTVETADWAKFKAQLVIDGDSVYFKDTGELIDGLRAQIPPDKFTVKTN